MRSNQRAGVIVSIGYEGRSIDEFVGLLADHRVQTVVDVRLTPISRKRGFSKNALAAALSAAGIAYRHRPELGNPKSNREGFRRGHRRARLRYEQRLDRSAAAAYMVTLDQVQEGTVALLCFEKQHDTCHRSTLAGKMLLDDPSVELITA